jgi:hypothetical protein
VLGDYEGERHLQLSGTRHHVVWRKFTDVSENRALSIIRVDIIVYNIRSVLLTGEQVIIFSEQVQNLQLILSYPVNEDSRTY